MSTRMVDAIRSARTELCHEPTEKRVRATLGGATVIDSTRAVLVWEPGRISPTFAVPAADLRADLAPSDVPAPDGDPPPVLHPGVPFRVHSAAGEELDVRADGTTRTAAAFRPADPDLAGHVLLDFAAFDAWFEEDEELFSHPRDPYHRIDVRRSSRHVRVELDGDLIAESVRPTLLFETQLPVRFYLPPEDIVVGLDPTATRTACPYKGAASYWAFEAGGRRRADLMWTYEHPLPDCAGVAGLVSFFDDKFDVVLDGRHKEPPRTLVAAIMLEEFGVD